MGITERRKREKEQQRRLILDAARQLIRENGIHNLTIRRLAAHIEYSPMSLYYHFADKDALLHALAREAFVALEDALPRPTGKPRTDLKRALLRYIEFGLGHPDDYEILFMTRRHSEPNQATGIAAIPEASGGRDAFAMLVAYVERCDGNMKRDSFATATLLWCGVHGLVSLLLTQTGFPFGAPTSLARNLVDVLIRGAFED